MEELLERNDFNDSTSGGFAARCRSGSYFCRYRSCPRAIQGFISSDLRQEHEASHAPRFRCSDSACGFFGRDLKNRTAMKKHNDKYHDDEGLAAIPTSLRRVSARPQHDRSRFSLKESSSASPQRSLTAAKEYDVQPGGMQPTGGASSDIRQHIMRDLGSHPTPTGWQQTVPIHIRVLLIQEMYVSEPLLRTSLTLMILELLSYPSSNQSII